MSKLKVSDNECIEEWQMLLAMLKVLVERGEKDKTKYEEIKDMTKASHKLTDRQIEGLLARCDWRISQIGVKQEDYTPNAYDQTRMNAKGVK